MNGSTDREQQIKDGVSAATELHGEPGTSGVGREQSDPASEGQAAQHEPASQTELSLPQQKLLSALLSAPDIQTAAKIAGVGRTTVHRWMQQPAFRDELERRRDAAFCEALATVKTHAVQAVTELAGLLSAKDDRLRRLVCNDLLAHAMRIRQLEDFERRLAALEKQFEKQ